MINEKFYKIYDTVTYSLVEFITSTAEVISSTTGATYKHHSEAIQAIERAQNESLSNGWFLNTSRFQILELSTYIGQTIQYESTLPGMILNFPESPDNVSKFRVIVKQAVLDGFKIIRQDLLNFALTSDKYNPILYQMVPPHMLQCLDEFTDVGLRCCDIDILGTISLTATTEQLTMYNIDELIKERSK